MNVTNLLNEIFQYAEECTNEKITQIELIPIYYAADTFLQGIKKIGTNFEILLIKNNQYYPTNATIQQLIDDNNKQYIWLPIQLLEQDKLLNSIQEFKQNLYKLNNFINAKIEYVNKNSNILTTTNMYTQHINAIVETKKMTIKLLVNIRKQCHVIKHKIKTFGDDVNKHEITELEIVTTPIETS